jgi:hypothetical protein
MENSAGSVWLNQFIDGTRKRKPWHWLKQISKFKNEVKN